MEVRCFSFMESTVTVRGSGAKKVQHDPPFFLCLRQAFIVFRPEENMLADCKTSAEPLLQRTSSAPGLCEPCIWLLLQSMFSASHLLQYDENGFLLVEKQNPVRRRT